MSKKHFHFFLFISIVGLQLYKLAAQPHCHFKHYSTEDGLPQYTIMDIMQDKNGLMWFATWDGLSKFDGYEFKNYKTIPGDSYYMKSNRIERIYEDGFSRIWLNTYDGDYHCFNPATHKFWGLQLVKDPKIKHKKPSGIFIVKSGNVWLPIKNSGAILIKKSVTDYELFDTESGKIKGDNIYSIIEDSEQNNWLLTNNGITLVYANNSETKSFFYENNDDKSREMQHFFAALEVNKQIYFGSQNGHVWIYNKENGLFTLLQLPTSVSVTQIKKLNSDNLLFATQNDGFILYNIKSKSFQKFNTKSLKSLNSDKLGEIFILNGNDIWFETEHVGIYKFNHKTGSLRYYRISTDDVTTLYFPPRTMVFQDIQGRTWVQPRGGGFSLYNPANETLEPFYNSLSTGEWRFSNLLHSAFSDRQGNLWMCTRSHGLEKVVFDRNLFDVKQINKPDRSTTTNDVRCVYEDKQNQLWISTKDCRLTAFNTKNQRLGCLNTSGKIVPNAYFPAIVYCMLQLPNNDILIGTKGKGIFHLSKGKMTNYTFETSNIYGISDNNIYSIFNDSENHTWIGTYGGGINLVQQQTDGTLRFINHRNHLKNFPIETAHRVRYITEGLHNKLYFGSTAGLVVCPVKFNSPENISFRMFSKEANNKHCLRSNDVHGICKTSKNETYIATFGGGINQITEYDKDGYPAKFSSYTMSDGLPSDVTLAIIEDKYKKLWISSENNLSRFDTERKIFENFAEIRRVMVNNNFSEASVAQLKSSEIIIGFSNGIIRFKPEGVLSTDFNPNIAFTNLQLFNKTVEVGDENSPLSSDINAINKLELTHKQNFITIEYAALDFVDPENIQYAYMLEGLDNDWNYVQKQRSANYTNLPKGTYIFKVKSTNSKGVWIENERMLEIEVLPAIWETGWAFLLYFLIICGLVYLSVRILFTIYQLRGNVELERKMSDMKLRFFTDISHEIRTPLTMITAPVDFLMTDANTPENIKKQLKTISHNTNRMLRLVNQILDFRKIQFLHLKVQEIIPGDIVKEICENFDDIAHEKHIRFEFHNNAPNDKIWVDTDCFEKIVMNLLSNAFKFSPPGKSIAVTILADEKSVSVQVKDHGAGISKEKLKNLFIRFSSFNEDKSKPSTGIGLSMVKELADKHSAKVAVESEPGIGSTFTVSFLRGISHFDKKVEILAQTGNSVQQEPEAETIIAHENTENEHNKNKKSSVLIVEDDADLRQFIRSIIENEYSILEAEDGMEGWILAQKHCPDFIVSDIMMPRMDGVELLEKIKTTLSTSHIPVILLTAKTTIESKLEGLSCGADDYITKPFSVPYFKARIVNLIQQRKQLQELFRNNLNTATGNVEFSPQPFTFSSQDEQMMNKVLALIEENMDNTDFSVEELGKNLMMSRSVFFKKIKSLTGLAPVEFIRDMKMKRASQILLSGEYMVKEVSYMVGISDTKYFAKCFKAKYGVTPAEFKSKKGII